MALGSILNVFLFFSRHCLLLSIICFAFFYHFIWFDMKAKKEKRKVSKNMKIEVRNVHFAKSFHFYLISALIKDHISNIFYEYLWLSHNFNIIVINTRLLHIFMQWQRKDIQWNGYSCSHSSSIFFILFVIILIVPSNDWRETYFKNDGICWWYTLDSIYLNF